MRSFALLCLLAVAFAGCGGAAPRDSAKNFKGEQRAVATTIEDVETAGRKQDANTICEKLLADSLLAVLKKQGVACKTAVKQQLKIADSFDTTVDDVTINGDKAVAKVTSGTGSKKSVDVLDLVKVGAAWKIALLRP